MDEETLGPAVWLDFDRPIVAVRALFFDVDMAVRERIHRGVRLKWLPRTPEGERRLRRHTRVLDKIHAEEIVIESGPDETWVQRFVDGPSAGTRFVARFEVLGDASGAGTRVRMHASVGPKGFAQGLGKLSPLGLEKALKRMLLEFKRALEGYEPGRARGAVNAVLAELYRAATAMRALDDDERKRVTGALLETAWSLACVDDGPDLAERDAMRAIVQGLWGKTLAPEVEDKMVAAAVQAIDRQGVEERCSALGRKLQAHGFGRLGVELAVLVAEVSCGLEPAELYALRVLAAAAGMREDELKTIVRATEEALSGGDPLSRMSTFV